MLDEDKIRATIILASKGKTKREDVKYVLDHLDHYTQRIYDMLQKREYFMYTPTKRTIKEKNKLREITVSMFFPNRIFDYLMVEAVKPYVRKSMYEYCIGNVNGRGIVYGKKVIERKYKDYKYFVKLDIRKFYPSIDSKEFMKFARTKIKDEDFLNFMEFVICQERCFPIGSYYSQWFSNWFLEDVDHYIKEVLRVPFYVRYVDDMLLMSNNKRKLKAAVKAINSKLRDKCLILKPTFQVHETIRGVDFLGFRFCQNGIKLRKSIFVSLNNRVRHIKKNHFASLKQAQSLLSYLGWLSHTTNGRHYYQTKIQKVIRKSKLEQIISNHDRMQALKRTP